MPMCRRASLPGQLRRQYAGWGDTGEHLPEGAGQSARRELHDAHGGVRRGLRGGHSGARQPGPHPGAYLPMHWHAVCHRCRPHWPSGHDQRDQAPVRAAACRTSVRVNGASARVILLATSETCAMATRPLPSSAGGARCRPPRTWASAPFNPGRRDFASRINRDEAPGGADEGWL